MVRPPCCEEMGLKKGPWTAEEDQILINFVNQNGHGNWRALPKLAGLLRCGKSCRLRWMNYLRPDIKRGNFTKEEEETIIKLHTELGNRWSHIASMLPGRTDNEIKNVWNTHLKKKLIRIATNKTTRPNSSEPSISHDPTLENNPEPDSPSSAASSLTNTTTTDDDGAFENLPEIDQSFWSEVFSDGDDVSVVSNFSPGSSDFRVSSSLIDGEGDMDFWLEMLGRAESENVLELGLPEF